MDFHEIVDKVRGVSPLFQAIGAVGAIASILLYWYRKNAMVQSELFQSENHILKLCRALTADNQRLQLAAAALLVERLGRPNKGRHLAYEHDAIIQSLISATIDNPTNGSGGAASLELSKFVGDSVAEALQAIVPAGARPGPRSPLADYYWQRARLSGSWWKRIDARGVDFFHANLDDAGLAEAHLQSAILKHASLQRAVLRGARLEGADLREAKLMGADLSGTDLAGAKLGGALYDGETRFPQGFDPPACGMVQVAAPLEAVRS
jgi:hypothetical protein